MGCGSRTMGPNNSFKPNLLRSTKAMAEKACHGFGSTTQVGLTLALGLRAKIMVTDTDENFYERADAHIHLANDQTTYIGRGTGGATSLRPEERRVGKEWVRTRSYLR